MSNLINRKFTNREKVLMLILVLVLLVGLYFYLVHYPITERTKEIEVEEEELFLQQTVADVRLQNYNEMKSELEEIFALPEDEITLMPDFDNRQTLLNYFNVIFAGTDEDLSYDEVRFNGNIAERTMRFSFSAYSYDKAIEVLTNLTRSGWRCLLDSLSINPIDGGDLTDSALRISGSITFYEVKRG